MKAKKRRHENITIWTDTVELLRKAAAHASVMSGEKVTQIQFMHDAICEKMNRDGIPTSK